METDFRDTRRFCPACGEKGSLSYYLVPDSERNYIAADGEARVEHFGVTRDYICGNCDCEFILVDAL